MDQDSDWQCYPALEPVSVQRLEPHALMLQAFGQLESGVAAMLMEVSCPKITWSILLFQS